MTQLTYSYDNDSEFQTDGALTLKAFANNASVIRGTNNAISI